MTIPFDSFGDNAEAHLRYAVGLEGEQLAEAVRHRIRDGSWRRATSAFVSAIGWLAHHNPPSARAVFAELADALIAGELDAHSRFVLQQGLHAKHSWNDVDCRRLASWFSCKATINDAPFAANLLQDKLSDVRRSLHAIAEWLVDHGGTELLAASRVRLLFVLIEMMHEVHDAARTEKALRYLLDNEGQLEPGSFSENQLEQVALAINALLEAELVRASILIELARKFPEREAGERLAILAQRDGWPALRDAMLSVLSNGQLRRVDAVAAWRVLFRGERPAADISLVRAAADDLRDALCDWWDYKKTPVSSRGEWAHVLTREVLRLSARRLGAPDAAALSTLAGYPDLAEAIGDGLHDAGAEGRDSSLLSALLQARTPNAIGAALALIRPPEAEPEPSQWTSSIEQAITTWIEEMLASEAAPFTAWLHRAKRVEWAKLDGDESLELRGETLVVNRGDVAALAVARLSDDELIASGALYIVHEFLHRYQQIGGPTAVRVVRQAHAETTLMHLDLGADHWAAVLLHRVRTRWGLTALKDVQGRTLPAFPVGARHTTAARSRKARRLVALRLDALVREFAPTAVSDDEYVFAEYGPTGGPFVIFASGQLWRRIGTASLHPQDAKTMFNAADAAVLVEDVDRALRSIVQTALSEPDEASAVEGIPESH